MKRVPLRMCLGCRQMKPKTKLTRTVKSPEGDISLDPTGKKPGRGAYICHDTDCLKRAIKSNALARAFKTKIPEDMTDKLHNFLSHLQMENPNES